MIINPFTFPTSPTPAIIIQENFVNNGSGPFANWLFGTPPDTVNVPGTTWNSAGQASDCFQRLYNGETSWNGDGIPWDIGADGYAGSYQNNTYPNLCDLGVYDNFRIDWDRLKSGGNGVKGGFCLFFRFPPSDNPGPTGPSIKFQTGAFNGQGFSVCTSGGRLGPFESPDVDCGSIPDGSHCTVFVIGDLIYFALNDVPINGLNNSTGFSSGNTGIAIGRQYDGDNGDVIANLTVTSLV